MKNETKKKISPLLAIALASSLVTSILAIQSSTSDNALFHVGHNSSTQSDGSHVASAASLPLPVDFHYKIKEKTGDAASGTKYAEIDEEFINTEIHCEFCTHITVKPGPKGQTGFAYVSDTELDLSAAKSVTLFVMGSDGGEKAKFKVAGKSSDTAQAAGRNNTNAVSASNSSASSSGLFTGKAFAISTEEVTLEDDWTPLSIDLSNVPKERLKGVKYPFAIEMSQIRGTQEFFMKHVVYETDEATLNPIPASEEEMLNATGLDSNATTLDSNATALNDTAASSVTENATGADDSIRNRTSDELIAEPDQIERADDDNNTSSDDRVSPLNETGDGIQENDITPPSDETESSGDDEDSNDAGADDAATINTAPVAKANEDLIAYPGDEIILDGLASFDEDDTDRLEYEWTQADGPNLEITDDDTATPTIMIPSDIDEDDEAVIDLVVSDGKDESEKDSVTVFIDHVDALEDLDDDSEKQIQSEELKPNNDEQSQWELSGCDDLVDCLSDENDITATLVGGRGEQDIEKTDLLSFEDLDADLQNEGEGVQIEYIVIEVDASKSAETGYIRVHVDSNTADNDNTETYESNAISIISERMKEYRVILETEPISDEEWTADSVDSIIAGYSYAGGQSEIEVSEITIHVYYTIPVVDDEEDETTPSSEEERQEEGSDSGEVDDNSNMNTTDHNGNLTG